MLTQTGAAHQVQRLRRLVPDRVRVTRTARIWRLTARNGARYAFTKVRRRTVGAERRAELDAQFAAVGDRRRSGTRADEGRHDEGRAAARIHHRGAAR
ncbi:MAG: hypothetical protein R2715_15560 [Ilumatobacteraceae bacterium]